MAIPANGDTIASIPSSVSVRGLGAPEPLPSHDDMRRDLASRLDDLTPHQVRDAWCQINGVRKQHTVDFKVSVWLPLVSRLYVTIAAGKEQRHQERLEQDGQTDPSRLAAFYAFVVFAIVGSSLFGFFCLAYLVKSMLKINIFAGQSIFHPLYALFLA